LDISSQRYFGARPCRFSSDSPFEKLLFAINYDHACPFARNALGVDSVTINAIKALLINEIHEKSEILRFLQNCAEPLRFKDKYIGTKTFPLHMSFQRKKRKSKSDH